MQKGVRIPFRGQRTSHDSASGASGEHPFSHHLCALVSMGAGTLRCREGEQRQRLLEE